MKSFKVFQVDSFTKERFRGNPAGVVLDADGLTDSQMQDIASEMNCSETVFVLAPTSADHEVWLRYFTPSMEAAICGHATIAAHYVRAKQNSLKSSTVMTRTGIGILPIDVLLEDGDYKIIMTLGKPQRWDRTTEKEREDLFNALAITEKDLDEKCPLQFASVTNAKVLFIGLKSRDKLNSLSPNMSSLENLSNRLDCTDYMVFTFDSDDKQILTCVRMFAPAIGIPEDPVTGTANGSLGAYLAYNELIDTSSPKTVYKSKQGEAIKRTGIVEVAVYIENKIPTKVQIGGNANIVFETELSF